jgi:hypothetical protein
MQFKSKVGVEVGTICNHTNFAQHFSRKLGNHLSADAGSSGFAMETLS